MFVCDQLQTDVWQPEFCGAGESNPTWTRVTVGHHQIANSLEWVAWNQNPVQVILCDGCGSEGCASGGYVHVSRLGRYVLWSAPQFDDDWDDPAEVREILYYMRTLGALAIPLDTWNAWSVKSSVSVPYARRLPPANHAAVADAWILGPGRSRDSIVTYLQERLLGGDTLSKKEAISLVARVSATLLATAHSPFEKPLVSPTEVGARLETLYFDGPSELDWPAFAFAGTNLYLALDRQHLIRLET